MKDLKRKFLSLVLFPKKVSFHLKFETVLNAVS